MRFIECVQYAAVVLVLVIAWGTVSFRTLSAASDNPVNVSSK